jgi:two-component system chemotaxis response regulator CheB
MKTIVIGASAGGIEALGQLLPALPADFGPTVIIVLHLPPDAGGLLPTLFKDSCPLPLREAADKEPLIPATVYFAPAGYHLLVETGGTFALSADAPVNYSRPSIDVLFESAAWALGSGVLGLLLTGANADGARGLETIRHAGGAAWVQQPDTARAPDMPRAAIALGAVDEILTVAQMGERLRAASFRATGSG